MLSSRCVGLSRSALSPAAFLGGLSTAWEIDLWGRLRNSTAAANATYLGTEDARRGIMLSLVSDVAAAYLELVELDHRLELAQQSLDAFKDTYKLFSERFGAGIASRTPHTFGMRRRPISRIARRLSSDSRTRTLRCAKRSISIDVLIVSEYP